MHRYPNVGSEGVLGMVARRSLGRQFVLVIIVELGLVTCVGVFNPALATYRLRQTETDRVARLTLSYLVTEHAGRLAARHSNMKDS